MRSSIHPDHAEEVNMKNNNAQPTDLTPAETSRLLKRVLKATFPGVAFRVRKGSGTAYDSVYVEWARPVDDTEAGEFRRAVSAVTDTFQGKSFDGMTDSTNYRDAIVEFNGEQFRSGAGYVLCSSWRAA